MSTDRLMTTAEYDEGKPKVTVSIKDLEAVSYTLGLLDGLGEPSSDRATIFVLRNRIRLALREAA